MLHLPGHRALVIPGDAVQIAQRRTRGAVAAYTPASAPSLAGWWKADDVSTLWTDSARTTQVAADGDRVGAWDDKSGNARHALQATAGDRGTYKTGIQNGKAVVRFDGVSDFLAAAYAYSGTVLTVAIAAVRRSAVSQTSAVTLYKASEIHDYDTVTQAIVFYENTGTIIQSYRNGSKSQATHPGNATAYQATSIFDATNNTMRLDGAAQTPVGSTGSFGYDNMILAARRDFAPGVFGEIDICELVICEAALSGTDLTNLEDYLTTEWGTP